MTQRSRPEKVASAATLSAISRTVRARGGLRSSRTAPSVVIARQKREARLQRVDRAIQYAEAYRFHVLSLGYRTARIRGR